ncbi:sugar kinase [Microbacterium sp. NPDC058389]|uniref:sugar kinase n=1 Tax=Microbacterium sp. NPDC058389 TaxID=3346475 RepID=UPI0036577A8F
MTNSRFLLTFGETMALFSTTDPLAYAGQARVGLGGAESNVAVTVSRLGVDAHWIGRRGADSLGDRVERTLRGEGVNVHAIIDPDSSTGLMIKERRSSVATNVWYYRDGSAGSRLSKADIPDELVAASGLLHVTGITPLLSPQAREATLHAVRIARESGVPVSFDINHRQRLAGGIDVVALYREIARQASIIFASEDEASIVAPDATDAHSAVLALADLGASQAIVKLGDAGCVASIDGEIHEVPAVPVNAVDTVGAGDAFVGGYLARTLQGAEPSERLDTAVATGAFACTVSGDWEGAPTESELAALYSTEQVAR